MDHIHRDYIGKLACSLDNSQIDLLVDINILFWNPIDIAKKYFLYEKNRKMLTDKNFEFMFDYFSVDIIKKLDSVSDDCYIDELIEGLILIKIYQHIICDE